MTEGFTGMLQLLADLEALGPAISGETAKKVEAAGNAMYVQVRGAYPRDDGDLIKGVVLEKKGPMRIRVRSRAPHAHLYEDGTWPRFTKHRKYRGKMGAKPTFVPAAIKFRYRMVTEILEAIRRHKVRGMTGTLDMVQRGD